MGKEFILATGNAHKAAELEAILGGVRILTMREAGFTGEIEENGATFAENAMIKCRAVWEFAHKPCLADDSGLCVDALDGRDQPIIDMCYEEDSTALADFNLVMLGSGAFVEVQGTGEGRPYTREELDNVVKVTAPAIQKMIDAQKAILER